MDKRPEITIHPIDNLKSAVNISFKKYGNFTEQEADLLFQKYFNYINSELAKTAYLHLLLKKLKAYLINTENLTLGRCLEILLLI